MSFKVSVGDVHPGGKGLSCFWIFWTWGGSDLAGLMLQIPLVLAPDILETYLNVVFHTDLTAGGR